MKTRIPLRLAPSNDAVVATALGRHPPRNAPTERGGCNNDCQSDSRVGAARAQRTGFTLIELLVVVAVILILAGLTLKLVRITVDRVKIARAKTEVQALVMAVEAYQKDTGRIPTNSSSAFFEALMGGSKKYIDWPANRMTFDRFLDPWGNAYRYDYAHKDAAGAATDVIGLGRVLFYVKSLGPDGLDNTPDDISSGQAMSN